MQVRSTIGGEVDVCAPGDTLLQAARQMKAKDHGALAVTVDDRLVGIVSERDVLRAVAERLNPEQVTVAEVMTPNPDSLDPEVDISDAAEWMLAAGYRHLPVVSGDALLGMVSIKDILWAVTGPSPDRQ